jgi:hypothetical protein
VADVVPDHCTDRTRPDQVLWGVARGPTSNREFLICNFADPLKTP